MSQQETTEGDRRADFVQRPGAVIQSLRDGASQNARIGRACNGNGGASMRAFSGWHSGRKPRENQNQVFGGCAGRTADPKDIRLENFFGGFSHNFNNLMMGIQGNFALILLKKTPEDPHYETLKKIEKIIETGCKIPSEILEKVSGYGMPKAYGEAPENSGEISPVRRDLSDPSGLLVDNRLAPINLLDEQIKMMLMVCEEIIFRFAGVLKEIRKMVASLLNSVEMGYFDHHKLETIEILTRRAAQVVGMLHQFTGRGRSRKIPFDLNRLISQVCRKFQKDHELIRFSVDLESKPLTMLGNRRHLVELIHHLLENAVEAQPAGGWVRIEASRYRTKMYRNGGNNFGETQAKTFLRIKIADGGPGISPDICKRIFDPFFSTKKSCRHFGLGLSSVFGITQDHGGHMIINAGECQGTTVQVYFSCCDCSEKPPGEESLLSSLLLRQKPGDFSTGLFRNSYHVVRLI
jgi:signal transduction histidine kinase